MVEPTGNQFAQAAADAEALMAESLTINRMVSLRTVGLQLVRLADEMIQNELNNGWDVDVELTHQTLSVSSCAHVVRSPLSLDQTVQDLVAVACPIVETLAWQQREDTGHRPDQGREMKPDVAKLLATKIKPGESLVPFRGVELNARTCPPDWSPFGGHEQSDK